LFLVIDRCEDVIEDSFAKMPASQPASQPNGLKFESLALFGKKCFFLQM
jgi:hypothetical protein